MSQVNSVLRAVAPAILLALVISSAHAQRTKHGADNVGRAVLWHKVDVGAQDTYLGPGGSAMRARSLAY